MGEMEQAILNLIDRNQHLGALLREASDEVDLCEKTTRVAPLRPSLSLAAATSENSLHLSMDACLSCIQAQSHISGTPVPTVAAIECAGELCRLQQTSPEIDFEQKKNIQCLIELIKRLTSQQLLNRTLFIQELGLKVKALPLELLWQLHACSAVPLDQYIGCNLGSPAVLQRLVQDISVLCSKVDVSDEASNQLKKDVLGVLLRCGYSKPEELLAVDQRLTTVTGDILDSIVLELLKLQNQASETVTDPRVAKLFETVRCLPAVDKDAISRFSTKQLQVLLQWSPDCDVTMAVARQHDRWTYTKAPQIATKMFTQLLVTMEEKQICPVLRKVIDDEQVNWQHTLILVSVFCVCFRQGSLLIKDLVTSLLKESLDGCRHLLLHAAFLLARQAAAEGSCDFPSYAQWFKDQFSTSASPHVTSSKTLAFFMEFLNSLVPHEPVHCLKAHVQHPPHMPYKCREVLMDYIALAKTRLSDFKESWQVNDVPGPGTSHKLQTGNQLAVEDVEIAVATFERTGRIHERVLQSSIFRRPYYMGQFLPMLLTPRMLPDIPDSTMRFIDALKSADKIPVPMYQKYIEACAMELRMLLEGVSSEDMDDPAVEPIDSLQEYLDSLPHLLLKEPTQASYYADIVGHISLISGRVTAVLEDLGMVPANAHNKEGAILLDINGRNTMEPTIMQVTDMLLGCFCKAHVLVVESRLPCTSLVTQNFTLMFANQRPLHYALYRRLFTLICHQGNTLSEDHITGLASLLVHMSALGERIPLVKLRTQNKQEAEPDQMPLLNLICEKMHHRTGDAMTFTLRFCKVVLARAAEVPESGHSQIIPQQLEQKFFYLLPRLEPASRLECIPVSGQPASNASTGCRPIVPGTSATDMQGEPVHEEACNLVGTKGPVSHQDQLSFEHWLGIELRVHLCRDCLTEAQRKHYHHWILYTHYLPQLAQSSDGDDPTIAYKRASTIILHALLDRYAEPSGKRDEHCPHGARQGQAWQGEDRSCGCSSSCQEIIQLLQELLRVWSMAVQRRTPCNYADCPWLLAEFVGRLMKLSEPRSEVAGQSLELAAGLEVSNQIMLAQCLPPYLLLTDCLSLIPPLAGLKHLTSYINVHLREHIQEDFCTFGYETVAAILQGALQLYAHVPQSDSGRAEDVVVVIEKLLQECPIFTLSVLRHWNTLGPLISQPGVVSPHHQPRVFAKLNHLQALIRAVCSAESGTSLASTDAISKLTSEPWVLVVAVVCSVTRLDGRSISVEELNSLEEIIISRLEGIFNEDKIRRCLFEYHVAQTAWLLLRQPTENQRIDGHCQAAAIVLSKQPSCLVACADDTMLRRDILQQSVSSFYPVVCFRILQRSSCHTLLRQASTDPKLLTAILHLYASLLRLHCQSDRPITELRGYPTTGGQQIMDLEFLQSCLALLQRVLINSSSQTLASVDATVLAVTDPEVRSIIAQRLRPR